MEDLESFSASFPIYSSSYWLGNTYILASVPRCFSIALLVFVFLRVFLLVYNSRLMLFSFHVFFDLSSVYLLCYFISLLSFSYYL
ncbi:hypothetical protein V1517DRAFT_331667 [Lipomyces orientalis]|uniref:Uncharacterized protein n=1 Tax=Lipomyces orientalis TaxID=1233043 RepID=A0ACC3TFI0_9ASCO